jgi:hypothetical protein
MAQGPSRNLIEGGIRRAMLPGFRFLFAAIILSMSILVFGLGAAALLRAAHEEVASNPTWRAAPEMMFAQQGDATRPVLAMLRIEPAAMEQKATDNVSPVAAPVEPAAIVSAPAEPAASPSTPDEPERIAALLKQEGSSQLETAKPEILAAENPAQGEAAPVQADTPAAAGETSIASSEQAAPPATDAAPAASEQISAATSAEPDAASTKIAALDSPSVAIETNPPAKAASAKPDRSAVKKRLQARRAAQRRRIAARARLAQQPAQSPADPFSQPTITVRKR